MSGKCENYFFGSNLNSRRRPEEPQVWDEGFQFALHVLLPVAIAALIWGRKAIASRFLLNLDRSCISVFFPTFSKREKLLKWISNYLPYLDGGIKAIWNDGSQLCTLINAVIPGACNNPHRHWKKNLSHGQALAYKYLGVIPVFTDVDFNHPITPSTEKRFIEYLGNIQLAIAKISPKENFTYTNQYVARGMGLVTGEQNRKTILYIYANNKNKYLNDLLINIKGPYNTYGSATLLGDELSKYLITRSMTNKTSFVDFASRKRRKSFFESISTDFSNLLAAKKEVAQSIEVKIEMEIGRAKVMFIPKYSGVFEICLTTNGEHITGSPYYIDIEKNTSGVIDNLKNDMKRSIKKYPLSVSPEDLKPRLLPILRSKTDSYFKNFNICEETFDFYFKPEEEIDGPKLDNIAESERSMLSSEEADDDICYLILNENDINSNNNNNNVYTKDKAGEVGKNNAQYNDADGKFNDFNANGLVGIENLKNRLEIDYSPLEDVKTIIKNTNERHDIATNKFKSSLIDDEKFIIAGNDKNKFSDSNDVIIEEKEPTCNDIEKEIVENNKNKTGCTKIMEIDENQASKRKTIDLTTIAESNATSIFKSEVATIAKSYENLLPRSNDSIIEKSEENPIITTAKKLENYASSNNVAGIEKSEENQSYKIALITSEKKLYNDPPTTKVAVIEENMKNRNYKNATSTTAKELENDHPGTDIAVIEKSEENQSYKIPLFTTAKKLQDDSRISTNNTLVIKESEENQIPGRKTGGIIVDTIIEKTHDLGSKMHENYRQISDDEGEDSFKSIEEIKTKLECYNPDLLVGHKAFNNKQTIIQKISPVLKDTAAHEVETIAMKPNKARDPTILSKNNSDTSSNSGSIERIKLQKTSAIDHDQLPPNLPNLLSDLQSKAFDSMSSEDSIDGSSKAHLTKRIEFWNKLSSQSSLDLSKSLGDLKTMTFNNSTRVLTKVKSLETQVHPSDILKKRRKLQRSHLLYTSADDLNFPSVRERKSLFLKGWNAESKVAFKAKAIKERVSIKDKIKLFDNTCKKTDDSTKNLDVIQECNLVKSKIKEGFEKAQHFFKELENQSSNQKSLTASVSYKSLLRNSNRSISESDVRKTNLKQAISLDVISYSNFKNSNRKSSEGTLFKANDVYSTKLQPG